MEKLEYKKSQNKERAPKKIESKKHKEAARRKFLEKQKAVEEAREKRTRLKVDTQIVLLTQIFNNFLQNLKDNTDVRKWATIFAKWIDYILTAESVKKWLDESLNNSIETYRKLSSNIFEYLKTTKLTEGEQKKIEKILSDFHTAAWEIYYNEMNIDRELFAKIITETDKNLEFISEERNVTYAHIKRVNKAFLPNFDCLYISSEKYQVPAELIVAIIQNDTSIGKHMATKNNFWNVWNDDWGARVNFDTPQDWLDAVAKNLKKRIDKFREYVKNRHPTVIELVTWKIKWWKRFFLEYMTHPKWPMRVASIYNKLAEKNYVKINDDTSEVMKNPEPSEYIPISIPVAQI
ncbi:MAG: hypothetical protein ACD_3C00196G0024 [uncultured bacterium (gcode 4)]|uniref:Uncharacterized protein n=1 Tax=uncultured bacterium (gcode 4) TaxID=1234023 RepID=K2F8Q4_9BACT|nr:MAG: hypothetical protein ACD_3C00196G0024 [uncultured bacterium (gcode 4)]